MCKALEEKENRDNRRSGGAGLRPAPLKLYKQLHPDPHTAPCACSFRVGSRERREMGLKEQLKRDQKGPSHHIVCGFVLQVTRKEGG